MIVGAVIGTALWNREITGESGTLSLTRLLPHPNAQGALPTTFRSLPGLFCDTAGAPLPPVHPKPVQLPPRCAPIQPLIRPSSPG